LKFSGRREEAVFGDGLSYDAWVGRMTLRTCDHQVLTPISVAEVSPSGGPFYKFPFVGKPVMVPATLPYMAIWVILIAIH